MAIFKFPKAAVNKLARKIIPQTGQAKEPFHRQAQVVAAMAEAQNAVIAANEGIARIVNGHDADGKLE